MISDGFKARIGKMPITLSMFVDRHGLWAKDWEFVVAVDIMFEDSFTTQLAPADYQSLPTEQQELIRNAPSSPKVPA